MEVNGPSSPIMITAMFLIGLAMIGYGAYEYNTQNSALENAEKINATIISTDIEVNQGRRGTDYIPEAEFRYSFEGEEYTSENVFPGTSSPSYNTESVAREEITNYSQGETVTAYVDPSSPGNAFLKHESTNTPVIMALIGIFIAGLSSYKAVKP